MPASKPKAVSVKLFVGGLPQEATDDDLRKQFSKFGELLEAQVIKDRNSGKSRGFGFVMLADGSKQDAALREVIDIRGRRASVKLHQEEGGSEAPTRREGDFRESETRKVFIGRLESSHTPEVLREAFDRRFGRVKDVYLAGGKKFGFVTFEAVADAKAALESGGIEIDGVKVVIKSADPVKDGGSRGSRSGRDTSPPRDSSSSYGAYPYGYGYYGMPLGYPQPGYYGYPAPAYGYPPPGYSYPPPAYGYAPPDYGYAYSGYPPPAGGYGPAPSAPRDAYGRPY